MADINNFIDKELVNSLVKINEQIILAGQNIDKVLLPAIKKLEETQAKLGKNTKENSTERKKLTTSQKEAARIAKQLETTEAKLLSLQKGQQDALLKTKTALQATTAAKKRELTSTNALTGSYIKINAELNKNITRYKGLSAEQRKNNKVGGQLLKNIQNQDKALKKLDTQMGRSQRNVGNYRQAFGSLVGAFGVAGGILGFVSVLKNAGNTIAQFDKAQATTAATLGKTKKEIDDLTKSAINLGKVTQFTATEVSILQNELAKLGFTSEEIVASTGGILDLAAATDSGLGESAKVAGAALRAFGLDASEMGRVVSVLAVATTKSALSFEDYAAGLSNVAPVAKSFGFTIEDTVALMGKLRDAGFDASKATTATRNILLNLADGSSKLSKALGEPIKDFNDFIPAMVKLRESGVDLNTTLQLTDKRSVAAFNQFLAGAESAAELRDAITDVNDELADMVDTKTDNVIGATQRLSSAWEGLILQFRGSSGVFAKTFDAFATFINAMTNETIDGAFSGGLKQQEIQQDVAKKLKTATEEQIQFTIKKNRERLLNEGKHGAEILRMLKERLVELVNARRASETAADQQEIDDKTAAEFEKTQIEKGEAAKRVKIAQKESDAKRDILEEEVSNFSKMNEKSRKFKSKTAKEERDKNQEFIDSTNQLELEKLDERNTAVTEENQTTFDNEVENRKAAFGAQQTLEEQQKEQAIQSALEVSDFLFNAKTQSLQREFQAAEGNAKKQAEISKKIANQEKKQALFNVAINTAVAVSKVWGQTGIFGVAAQIPVLIMGALQAGLIAAAPIPQFASGVTNFGGGIAELGEEGTEMVKERSGKVWLAENRGLYNLQQGSTVLTAPQTQKELNDKRIVDELKLTRKAIQRQPRQRSESQFDKRQRGMKDGYHMMKNRLN